jgi:hypothetical protein
MGNGSRARSRAVEAVDLTTSQKTTVTIRNSWVESRAPTALPHSGQNLARSTRPLPQLGPVAMSRSIWTMQQGRPSCWRHSQQVADREETGYSKRRWLATLSPGRGTEPSRGVWKVAPERKRSARDYEQALRRQELAAGRALVQALPADASPGARELAAARRVLTQALFELRRLGRDLDMEIEGLGSRQRPAAGPTRAGRTGSGPGELDRFESVRNAVEEVAERWEHRRDQLTAELDRRQGRRPGQAGGRRPDGQARSRSGGQAQPRQGGQPRRWPGGTKNDRVRGAKGGAPARPERPRSPRSRRSPG